MPSFSISAFDKVLNADISTLSAKIATTGDISGLNISSSVSSDKLFQSVSSSKTMSNVFGVFDTKQAVSGLSGGSSSTFSSEQVAKLDASKINNLQAKLGISVTTDVLLATGVAQVMTNITDVLQTALASADIAFTAQLEMPEISIDIEAYPGNLTTDVAISSIIPSAMSVADYNALNDSFNNSGLSKYNTCEALMAALGYSASVTDPSAIATALKALFAQLAKHDMINVASCLANAMKLLSPKDQASLTEHLIEAGAIGSMSDVAGSINQAAITNPLRVLRLIGMNREVSYDPYTGLPNNTFDSGATKTAADALFVTLGIADPSVVFEYSDDSHNQPSISLDDEKIYDQNALSNTPDNGFAGYCFGDSGTDSLLASIPITLFV